MNFRVSKTFKDAAVAGMFSLLGAGVTLLVMKNKKLNNYENKDIATNAALEEFPLRKEESPMKTQAELEQEIANVEIVKKLRNDKDNWKELPLSFGLKENHKKMSFVHSTLNQPDHLLLPPTMFVEKDQKQVVFVFYIGKKLCGHPGFTHGGIQAILYDEAMARPAFLNLPKRTGFTAYLNITYKSPAPVNQILIMKCSVKDTGERKALITATLENLDNTLISTAESLYVAPRNTELLEDRSKTLVV
ncbi:hypothetical protein BB561_000135 [Smittium simulii]|uniref:Thioesterase domain-containing protein n=1 Tax=Smittium simulii TaxID=133385 RepID=A0A2T9Z0E3_9FUNG|nr:hypothetical protein BB561_000135 [Smittium simulii]